MTTEIQESKVVTNAISKKDAKKAEKKAAEQHAKTIYDQAKEQGQSYYEAAASASEKTSFSEKRDEVNKELKKMYDLKLISKKEYQEAKKANEEAYNNEVRRQFRMLDSDATTKKGQRKDYQKQIDENEAFTKQEKKDIKDLTKKGSWVNQFAEWAGYKRESSEKRHINTETQRAILADRKKTALVDGKELKLSKDAKAMMEKSGLSYEQLYEIGDLIAGDSDATINYSYKYHTGENKNLLGELSERTGKDFKDDAKAVGKLFSDLGYKVEPKVYTGHAVGGALAGAGLGASGFCEKVSQTQSVTGATASSSVVNQSQKVIPVGILTTAVGAAAGTGVAIAKDIRRVEDNVLGQDRDLAKDFETVKEYNKYIDNACTKEGAEIMKGIASFYTDGDKLRNEELRSALKAAAGKDSSLNYEEADGLYTDLLKGKKEVPPVVQEEEIEEEEEPCKVVELAPTTEEVDVDAATHCHTIRKGDSWSNVLEARYNIHGDDLKALVRQMKSAYYEANKEELNKQGIKSDKGAFFIKGKEWCLPEKVTVNNKEYTYQDDAKYKAGTVVRGKFGSVTNGSYRFTEKATETTYHASTSCNPNTVHSSKESQDAANKKAAATIK